jgi:Porin PorA
MRRFISPVLIGLGTFLIVVGVLVRVYAYPELAKVPANYDSTTYLEATDATRARDGRPGHLLAHRRR